MNFVLAMWNCQECYCKTLCSSRGGGVPSLSSCRLGAIRGWEVQGMGESNVIGIVRGGEEFGGIRGDWYGN